MDNELRKKRVLEGIAMLEKGIDPYPNHWNRGINYYGLSESGGEILFLNGYEFDCIYLNGFKYTEDPYDIKTMLHNWKRFYELIKDLK